MTDIVERLRNVRWVAPNVSEHKAETVCLEAADEIEHLREALNGLYDAYMELTYDSPVSSDAAILEKTRAALSKGKP